MFDDIVEQRIREAMERGEFDNLEGAGKPQDHDAYFATPDDLRMGYSVLRQAGYLPAEVQFSKEIAGLQERIRACEDEAERSRLAAALRDKRLALDLLLERRRRSERPRRPRERWLPKFR